MRLSLFRGAEDNRPAPYVTSWPDFVAEVLKNGHIPAAVPFDALGDKDRERAFKNAQPMFCPAEFRDGGRRSTADAVAVHCGVGDLDHLNQDQLGDFLLHMDTMGLEFLLYSGWSHELYEGHLSFRVIVPFNRPVSAREWDAFWPRMNHALGGWCDPQCKNVDRAYFLPSCPTQRAAKAQIFHHPGQPLNVDQWGSIPLSAEALAVSRVATPVSREEVAAFQKRLVKANPETGLALGRVLNGEPWAEPGFRDNVLYKLAGDLAKAFPSGDPRSLALVFQQSVTHYGAEFPLDAVQEKIQRRQGEILQEQERKQEQAVAARKLAIRQAFRTERDTPYTEEEVARFAAEAGCSVETFRRRWVIQKGSAFYFYVDGGYRGPYGKDDGTLAAHIYLSPATSVGVRLEELTISGDFVRRSASDLAMEYGSVADGIVADLTAQVTHYDAQEAELVEAPCPLRPLEPVYNPDVHTWLRLLGGSEYPNLELWLSWTTSLNLPCAALFIEGPPGCGKSLLALALSRLWTTGGPTTITQAMGNWNDSIARCPLIFADEKMATDWRGRARTADLREFIQAQVRPYTRKYVPDGIMRGAVRVILAANNRHLLDGEESLTPWDVAAIAGRIVHIEAGEAPGRFLAERGWAPGTGQEDVIARHILWLVENVERPANPPRFLVSSSASKLHRSMATSTVMGSAVAHWLVSFLLDPGRLRVRPPGDSAHLVRVRNGVLHVNPRALTDHWDTYKTNVAPDRATAKRVMEGIQGMSPTRADSRVSLTVAGQAGRPKFYVIRTEDLVEWANNHGHSTADEILGALRQLEDPPMGPGQPGSM